MRRVSKVQRKTKVITYVEQQIWYVWLRKETERDGGGGQRGEGLWEKGENSQNKK